MATTDPYHSRDVERGEIVPRPDPVVWGKADEGPLSADQVASYEHNGYLVWHNVFDEADVKALAAAARKLRDEADPSRPDVVVEPESRAIRSLFRVHLGGAFGRLAADPRLAGAARQLLDSDVYVHQSRVNYKPGFDGRPFPWHSDFETWHVEDGMPRPRALSASVLLTDNVEHNGPLLVVPGSQREYMRCVGETPEDHFQVSLVNQTYGVPSRNQLFELVDLYGVDSATGTSGSVVLFDCNLIHGSGGNITPLPRHNVFLVYNSVENAVVEPFGKRPPRPEFLGERQVEPLPS